MKSAKISRYAVFNNYIKKLFQNIWHMQAYYTYSSLYKAFLARMEVDIQLNRSVACIFLVSLLTATIDRAKRDWQQN